MSGIRYFSEVLNQKGAPALYEDTISNRPAATFEGRLFFATDVVSGNTIFRDNGNGTWSALAGNAGGGASFINGVTNLTGGVGLGGSLDQDTEILLDAQYFKFTYNGDCLLLDPVNDLYYFGKGNALDTGCGIHIESARVYTRYLTYEQGINLDFTNRYFALGDYNNDFYNTSLYVDDVNLLINTQCQGQDKGITLQFANNTYKFGDYLALSNNANISIFDNDRTISIFAGNNNNTYILLEDNDALITFSSATGSYNFQNIPAYANNAAALAAGLIIGSIYRSSTGGGDTLHIVH